MNKVKFVATGIVGQEIFGMLIGDQSNPLIKSGFWRTTDLVEAADRAMWAAQLNPSKVEIEIVDYRKGEIK